MLFGVVRSHAEWIGLVVGILFTVVVAWTVDRTWAIATLAFILGSGGTLWGAAVVHFRRLLVRTIG